MVDKNTAFNRGEGSGEFAENDPLAELARIVGYEDRPQHVPPQAAHAPNSQQRREPSFNLEDELLREFAIYDAPRDEAPVGGNDEAVPAVAPIHANDFLQRVEDVFARREPEFQSEPVYEAPVAEDYLSEPLYEDHYTANNDQITDALMHTMAAEPHAYAEDIYADPHGAQPQAPVEDYGYVSAPQSVDQFDYVEPAYEEPVEYPQFSDNINLADELESSVSEPSLYNDEQHVSEYSYEPAPVAPEPIVTPVAPVRAQSSAKSSLEYSSMRQPLGNFSMSRATPFIPKTPVQSPAAPTHNTAPQAEFVPVQQAPVPTPSPLQGTAPSSDFDALIADVSRYTIDKAESPLAERKVENSHPASVSKSVEPEFDLTDADFEAALDDLDFEFNLSEIEVVEPVQSSTGTARSSLSDSARVEPVAPAIARESVTVAESNRAIYSEPVTQKPAPAVQAPAFQDLPFDVEQIADVNEAPEAIADFDVPELPPLAIEPKAPVRRQDDDLELDTELAALFTPSNVGLDRNRNGEKTQAQPETRTSDVDEFERALEEDFRRSLQENPTKPSKIQATPLDDLDQLESDDVTGETGVNKKWMMRAAAAIGAFVVLGGAYAAFFSGSSVTGDGQPVIIAADDEPMKVVPENPGGRVVPNQDKAVYDRVAGGAPSEPKQPALISSDETPVDVVQRTLIPEQSAEDYDDDLGGAESAESNLIDTNDPRLLPSETAEEPAAAEPVPVAPRRVRTMIVKSDGTLVTQEIEAPAAPVVATAPTPATPAPSAAAPQAQQTTPTPAPVVVTETPAPAPVATPVAPSTPAPAPVQVQEVAAAPAPAAEQPASTNTASSGGFYIQIASLPSEADAQKSYRNMSSRYASVIGGRGVDIKRADIPGKGTYYRVRIPAGDRAEANALCQRFQSAGGSCLVTR